MFRTSIMMIQTASRSLGFGLASTWKNCVAVAMAVGAVTLFAPNIGVAQHHGGGMHHSGGGMHHSGGGMHHSGGSIGGGTHHHGGYYGGNSYYRGGSYGYGGIGIGIGLGSLGYGSSYYGNSYNSYPRSYGNSYYGNSYGNSYGNPYYGNSSYGTYSSPQYYRSSPVYSTQINTAPAAVVSQPVMGNPLNGELRPGMVLPDGAVVISVDPVR